LEGFAYGTGLLPEQVWDGEDIPGHHLEFGKPTGAAMPLMWAHAEYIKLLRTKRDGRVFDLVPEVAARYLPHEECQAVEVWKLNRQVQQVGAGMLLRVLAPRDFTLRWSFDGWGTDSTASARGTGVGIWYVDLAPGNERGDHIRFTFRWEDTNQWDGSEYRVAVVR
jgi:glucoamylase